MKNLKILMFGIVAIMGISSTAMAQVPCSSWNECQTLRESLREQLKAVDAQISVWSNARKVAWVEVNGVKWSSVLPYSYRNVDLDIPMPPIHGIKQIARIPPFNGIIRKSQATEACKALGEEWSLPTREDFKRLENDWKKIPGMKNQRFWSSSLYFYNPEIAFYFNGGSGGVDNPELREYQESVVCVARS